MSCGSATSLIRLFGIAAPDISLQSRPPRAALSPRTGGRPAHRLHRGRTGQHRGTIARHLHHRRHRSRDRAAGARPGRGLPGRRSRRHWRSASSLRATTPRKPMPASASSASGRRATPRRPQQPPTTDAAAKRDPEMDRAGAAARSHRAAGDHRARSPAGATARGIERDGRFRRPGPRRCAAGGGVCDPRRCAGTGRDGTADFIQDLPIPGSHHGLLSLPGCHRVRGQRRPARCPAGRVLPPAWCGSMPCAKAPRT